MAMHIKFINTQENQNIYYKYNEFKKTNMTEENKTDRQTSHEKDHTVFLRKLICPNQ